MDTSHAYAVKPSIEGGFTVTEFHDLAKGYHEQPIASFTSACDLIVWLAKQHGLHIEQLFAEGTPNASASPPLVGERAGESIIPKSPGLCEDEGCSHHGTEHVCLNWIEWSGYRSTMLSSDTDLPCMIRMRSGKERPGTTFDVPGHWSWVRNDHHSPNDVVAYRLV